MWRAQSKDLLPQRCWGMLAVSQQMVAFVAESRKVLSHRLADCQVRKAQESAAAETMQMIQRATALFQQRSLQTASH